MPLFIPTIINDDVSHNPLHSHAEGMFVNFRRKLQQFGGLAVDYRSHVVEFKVDVPGSEQLLYIGNKASTLGVSVPSGMMVICINAIRSSFDKS